MSIIHCSHIINDSALRLETELRGLARALEKLGEVERHNTSLFIPPLEPPPDPPPGRVARKDRGALPDARERGGKPAGQVLICGLGLRLEHMTVETIKTLKKCDIVFHDFLDEKAAAQVRALCADLRDLRKLRRDESEEATADVVLAAVAPGRTVAFLCYGHPMVLQWTAENLMRRCAAAGIPLRVTAALSALDEIFVAIGTPVIREGLQIRLPHEALRKKMPLLPHIPAIFMLLNHLWDLPDVRVADLVKYLKNIYPPEHRMLLIRCRRVMNDPLLRLETSLRGLAGALAKLPVKERFSTSLFIPELTEPPKKQ